MLSKSWLVRLSEVMCYTLLIDNKDRNIVLFLKKRNHVQLGIDLGQSAKTVLHDVLQQNVACTILGSDHMGVRVQPEARGRHCMPLRRGP